MYLCIGAFTICTVCMYLSLGWKYNAKYHGRGGVVMSAWDNYISVSLSIKSFVGGY